MTDHRTKLTTKLTTIFPDLGAGGTQDSRAATVFKGQVAGGPEEDGGVGPMSFDEMYDQPVHAEFLSGAVNGPLRRGADAAGRAIFGTPRLRSIAVIASGGLAFAALGAFLGGLGSDVAVSPAAAHPLTTSHLSAPRGSAAFGPANPPFRAGTLAQAVVPAGSGAVTPSTSNDSSPVGAASAPVTTVGGGSSGGAPRHRRSPTAQRSLRCGCQSPPPRP
jgi:hypothetical protein